MAYPANGVMGTGQGCSSVIRINEGVVRTQALERLSGAIRSGLDEAMGTQREHNPRTFSEEGECSPWGRTEQLSNEQSAPNSRESGAISIGAHRSLWNATHAAFAGKL